MSNISQFPSSKQRSVDQAGQWVAALERGITASEERDLNAWLAASKRNRQEFLELARLWDQMDSLGRLAELFPEQQIASRRAVLWTRVSLAASVLLAVSFVVVSALSFDQSPEDSVNVASSNYTEVYQTAVGEQVAHKLPDGSDVLLNTNSLVKVEYTDSNRLLILESGEIHIRVAHDSTRPLSVMAGNRIVQAIGTEFNVEITQDQSIELVVTEGIVKIGILNRPIEDIPLDTPILLTQNSTLLTEGQEVVLEDGESGIEEPDAKRIDEDEISVRLSWRDGNLVFQGESLEQAVAEVERYTAVEFVIVDEEAKNIRVAGLFKAGDVDGLLAALRNHFNISYEWQGDETILLSAEK